MTIRPLFALLLGACLAGCGEERHPEHAIGGPIMGTTYSVRVVSLPATADLDTLASDVHATLVDIESRMSTYRPDSELSRFNRYEGTEWFAITAETLAVVSAALQVSALTGGAFDITVGPLVNLWGFGADGDREAPPTPEEIERERRRTGFDRLELRSAPPAIRKTRPDVYVDLSAIAKGYAVDQVAELLEAQGIDNYLVEVGGEVRGRGHNRLGERWRIAIERPSIGHRSVQRVLHITDRAIATSGGYRNFFEYRGRRYSHFIDPRTGAPVVHDLASVTVIGESAMMADAWATAFTVLGPETGAALADREGIAALFLSGPEGELSAHSTRSFAEYEALP